MSHTTTVPGQTHDLPTTPAGVRAAYITDPQALCRVLEEHTPPVVRTYWDLGCAACGAANGQRCRSLDGHFTGVHAIRANLHACLRDCALPLLGDVAAYREVSPTQFVIDVTRTIGPGQRSMHDRVQVKRRHNAAPHVFSLALGIYRDASAGYLREISDWAYPGMSLRRGALYRAAVVVPDVPVAYQMIGTLGSDIIVGPRGHRATLAQVLFATRFVDPIAAHFPFLEPDGRYRFAGVAEAFPGQWPEDAVEAALGGDLVRLWPYMASD